VNRASVRFARGLAAAVAGFALLAGCTAPATSPLTPASTSGYQGVLLDRPYVMPDTELTDTRGTAFNLRTGSPRPVIIVYYGYTFCPDICLGTLTDLAAALNRVPEDVRQSIEVVFITVDPERDTPEVLAEYLRRIDPGFVGLTGGAEDIEAVAASMGVGLQGRVDVPGGGYEVNHTAQVIGFDRERLGRVVWTQGTPIGAYRADFERLVRQQG